ncbi:MAG: hypothetical protein E6G17_07275 [Actinobacteria bacterium]|nr:MAG: hypothetical protein E6G17_07275 [Actinomycetota bacterium]
MSEQQEQVLSSTDDAGRVDPAGEFSQVVVRAVANSGDLAALTRPLLEALAKLSGLESTYLAVFDWDRREQEVRVVHSVGKVQVREGIRLPLPAGISQETLPGVTRSPAQLVARAFPDSLVAQRLGLEAYVSVPVVVAQHQLFGMLCGASQAPRDVSETIVSVMEFFAQIIADHVTRADVAATQQRATVAEEKLSSRATFLVQAEHQLKTPLTVLEGASMTLLDRWRELPDHHRVQLLTMLVRNARDMARRVDELLVEARSDVQTRELVPTSVELAPLVKMLAEAFGSVSPSHEVVAEAPAGIFAWADPAPLYQVLGHLLDNATKYSPGGGTIRVRVTKTPQDAQIDVIDEGVGLPEGIDVFEPFLRGGSNEVTATPGIGLGLHIVRNLIVAMGGSVTARRNKTRGSTFTVRLPAAPDPA